MIASDHIVAPHCAARLGNGIEAPSGLESASTPPTRRWRRSALVAVLASTFAFSGLTRAAELQVIATGLNNPRGLDFAPNGALYIAEAGVGGSGPIVEGPEGPLQFGLSGSVTRVFKGVQERIITGLPSLAGDGGFAAVGPSDISFAKTGTGVLTIGLGLDPAERDHVLGAQASLMGGVFQFNPSGNLRLLADLAAYEHRNDPDGQGPDSNPNGAWSEPAGTYVVDAGANALLYIAANRHISVITVFPNRSATTPPFLPQPPFPPVLSMQPVPTNVVRGPDGAFYVSELTGFPFPAGEARIYRVVPGSEPQVHATGFTNIIDLVFDSQGNLYVLEIDANGLLAPGVAGRLARVNAGTNTVDTIIDAGLVMPSGMAIGPDGAIYITNFGTSPGGGTVVRVQP
jgi:hypothetical protein